LHVTVVVMNFQWEYLLVEFNDSSWC